MSRQAVRAAVATFFGGTLVDGTRGKYQGGPVAALGTVFLAPPKEFPEDDFTAGQQGGGMEAGAIGVVRISRQRENRVAGGRPAGIKRIGYEARLDCYHLAKTADAIDAQDDLDAMVDALEALLRADPTLAGAVFSAGEGDVSSLAGDAGFIEWTFGEPATVDERTETYAALTFNVVEHASG